MPKFEPGDVVMLRSGGPYMTISVVTPTGELACDWFDGPAFYNGTFHPSSVKFVEEPVAAPHDPDE